MAFKEINIEELKVNPLTLFGKDWALITAGNEINGYNGMTVAWGNLGSVWDRRTEKGKIIIPTANVYVRPQRYTNEFFEREELFTISWLDPSMKKVFGYMGSRSGRNEDKIKNAGLKPLFIDGTTAYNEASMILVCKKIYQNDLLEEGFHETSILEENYPKRDLHTMYVGEILHIYVKED